MKANRPVADLLNRHVEWEPVVPRAWGKVIDGEFAWCVRSEDPLETPYTIVWKEDVNCCNSVPRTWHFPDSGDSEHKGRKWRKPVHSAIEINTLRRIRLLFCVRIIANARQLMKQTRDSEHSARSSLDLAILTLCVGRSQIRNPECCFGDSLDTRDEVRLVRSLGDTLLRQYDHFASNDPSFAPSSLVDCPFWPNIERAAQAVIDSLYE